MPPSRQLSTMNRIGTQVKARQAKRLETTLYRTVPTARSREKWLGHQQFRGDMALSACARCFVSDRPVRKSCVTVNHMLAILAYMLLARGIDQTDVQVGGSSFPLSLSLFLSFSLSPSRSVALFLSRFLSACPLAANVARVRCVASTGKQNTVYSWCSNFRVVAMTRV